MPRVIEVNFHKTADVWTETDITQTRTVQELIDILSTSDVDPLLSVTWQVVLNAPVSVPNQNKVMLRRAKKVAQVIGRSVEAFDQLNDVTYGCVLVS